MSCLTVYKDCNLDTTHVSNIFIDEYMNDANDAELKVYFYLLRMVNANLSTSMSELAEKFNHTERDILRSLSYWEKKNLLSLDYNASKEVVGIHFTEVTSANVKNKQDIAPVVSLLPSKDVAVNDSSDHPTVSPFKKEPSFEKPMYSIEDMRNFNETSRATELTFLAETYLGRTLSPNDIQSLYFYVDILHFSTDLIDHLLQYCVDLGKRKFAYIDKVAITWAENNISTWKEAQVFVEKYNSTVLTIMKTLGKSGLVPTAPELDFIRTWTTTYGFSMPLIIEACKRTVLAVDTHRFQYANSILKNWNTHSIYTLEDIASFDKSFHAKKVAKSSSAKNNQFNQFSQRSYDFEALEKELLN